MGRRRIIHVFDASALIAHAKREPGAVEMDTLLPDPSPSRFVHAVNPFEVLYHSLKRGDQTGGNDVLHTLSRIGFVTREDMDRPFWHSVAYAKTAIR